MFDEKELNDCKPAVDLASDLYHNSRSTGIAPTLPAALPTPEESMVASCPRKLFRPGSAALRNIRNDNCLWSIRFPPAISYLPQDANIDEKEDKLDRPFLTQFSD